MKRDIARWRGKWILILEWISAVFCNLFFCSYSLICECLGVDALAKQSMHEQSWGFHISDGWNTGKSFRIGGIATHSEMLVPTQLLLFLTLLKSFTRAQGKWHLTIKEDMAKINMSHIITTRFILLFSTILIAHHKEKIIILISVSNSSWISLLQIILLD